MTKLVDQYKVSGESQKDFASKHGLSKSKFHYWLTKRSKAEKVSPIVNRPTFVPIEITPSSLAKTDQSILIRSKSGVEIEIPV
jgi:hypothetical protein